MKQCVDPKLKGEYPPKAVAKVINSFYISPVRHYFKLTCVCFNGKKQLAAVAALCVQYESEFRPNMSIVVKALQPLLRSSSGTASAAARSAQT